MATERTEFETEVRELVARVLRGVLDGPDATLTNPQASDTGNTDECIAIGADHGGFALKQTLKANLIEAGWSVEDCGTDSAEACDYPEFAHAVARQVATGKCVAGIMIDGAGIGSAMTANKVPGVRAAACYDLSTARNSREHNRANVLTLGAGLTGAALAWQIVEEWLGTPWGTGRHHQRVALINEIEALYATSEA
ncbi:MAG: ribose 5-phosphate isomerase B [Acidimicrobiales bacterium]